MPDGSDSSHLKPLDSGQALFTLLGLIYKAGQYRGGRLVCSSILVGFNFAPALFLFALFHAHLLIESLSVTIYVSSY